MKTIAGVRKELGEIRHYYANQNDFELITRSIGKLSSLKMVEAYNNFIKDAPIKLVDLYVCLYMNNNSQETVSVDWGCSVGHIKVLNKKLYEYFVDKFNKGES